MVGAWCMREHQLQDWWDDQQGSSQLLGGVQTHRVAGEEIKYCPGGEIGRHKGLIEWKCWEALLNLSTTEKCTGSQFKKLVQDRPVDGLWQDERLKA